MTSISFNLSGKLNPYLLDLLRVVNDEAQSLGTLFFIVGATARDIVLEHCHAIKPFRGTRDLDIGVEVAGWVEFQRLTKALIDTKKFEQTSDLYRLRSEMFHLDIVPFGGISADHRTISWPPDQQVIMNIMGFQEAYDSALTVRLCDESPLEVKVPTIPGMALMKQISWRDRYPERPKDAEDLVFLMEHYDEAGNIDRLYEKEAALLQEEKFDQTLAGIRLLGRDMAAMAGPATAEEIIAILEMETGGQNRYRLVPDMIREARLFDKFDEMFAKVEKLKQGFSERYQGK
jgi:predicted nucleotidyltransferase